VTQGRTIWNSDGTDGPALICAPTPEPKPEPVKDKGAKFEALKKTLTAGIKVVSAPQLFPTPHDLAQRMASLADIQPDHRVLEPSAGTGALLNGITQSPREIVAVEINVSLADRLRQTQGSNCRVINADFLQCNGDLGTFDRIVMNPPFQNGADVLHVRHALNKLKAGGKLVAIVAGGPKQKACLEPLADFWEELPDGTFSEQGTQVRTVLLVIEKRG
jgi:protein-L-isoaspartate O-methyltransferase